MTSSNYVIIASHNFLNFYVLCKYMVNFNVPKLRLLGSKIGSKTKVAAFWKWYLIKDAIMKMLISTKIYCNEIKPYMMNHYFTKFNVCGVNQSGIRDKVRESPNLALESKRKRYQRVNKKWAIRHLSLTI